MFRHARDEAGGKQKKYMDERKESFITVPQFSNREQSSYIRSLQSTGKEGEENRTDKMIYKK